MTRLITAPATGPDAVTPSEFIRALRPQPRPIDVLCEQLFTAAFVDGDREACAAIREQIAELAREPHSELRPEHASKWDGERTKAA